MLINLMGGVLPIMISHGMDSGNILALIGYGCINIFAYVSMVIAVILLKTPGFWGFLAGCVLLFVIG